MEHMLVPEDADITGVVLEDGVRATCSVRALGGRLLLVGTDRGTVLTFAQVRGAGEAWEMVPVCQQALHHGPVYHLALSASHLVCSAGHDARCCVAPLTALATPPEDRTDVAADVYRWIEAHSLPVVHACFLSDGSTIASVDAGGMLVVSRLSGSGVVEQERIACGFPARVLALSLDETCCFVGGTGLARVDLCHPYRPVDAFNTATSAPPDSTRGPQSHPALTHLRRLDERGAEVAMPPAGTLVSGLCVSSLDGAVTAAFSPRGPASKGAAPAVPLSTAQWSVDNPKWYVARTYTETAAAGAVSAPAPPSTPRVTHSKYATRDGIVRCRQQWPSVLTSRVVLNASSWHLEEPAQDSANVASWFSSDLLSQSFARVKAATSPLTASGHASKPVVAATTAEKLSQEEERNKKLQETCNELAHTLKTLMEQRKRSKKTKTKLHS